jgi:hypothetical protein
MSKLILATEQGIVICVRDDDNWKESLRALKDYSVTSAIAREVIWPGRKMASSI